MTTPPVEAVGLKLAAVAEDLREETMDKFAETFGAEDKHAGSGAASRRAREHLAAHWPTRSLDLVSGKEVIARLSTWCQETCGTSLSVAGIVGAMQPDEVDKEVKDVLSAILERKRLPRPAPAAP